jgi:hypothetical protein
MNAHDGVMAKAAHQTGLLPVVRAQVIVILHTIGNRKPGPNGRAIEPASKKNPLTAIARPRLSAKRDRNSGRDKCLFEFAKVLAQHIEIATRRKATWREPPAFRRRQPQSLVTRYPYRVRPTTLATRNGTSQRAAIVISVSAPRHPRDQKQYHGTAKGRNT